MPGTERMDEPGFTSQGLVSNSQYLKSSRRLKNSRILIAGLGLMGGSLALALRGKCQSIWGVDSDGAVVQAALARGVVDRAAENLDELLPQVDCLILAAPVGAILNILQGLGEGVPSLGEGILSRDGGDFTPDKLVVMDLGSTKQEILHSLDRLPAGYDPIGGHPMCGKEKASLEYAEANLYQGATFVLSPLTRTTQHAYDLAVELVEAIGAIPLWLDAATHDRWAAATSHFPYLLANSLAQVTSGESAPLVGPGFRSTARLAGSPPAMMADVLLTNSANLLAHSRLLRERLEVLENILASGDRAELLTCLSQGQDSYYRLINLPGGRAGNPVG